MDRLFDVALLTSNERGFLSALVGKDSKTPEADSNIVTAESADSRTASEVFDGSSVDRITDSWLGSLCVDYGILEPAELKACEYEAIIRCREAGVAREKK